MNAAELGTVIRAARVRSGLSQADLAQLASLSRATVNYVESGRADIGIDALLRLLDTLDLRLAVSGPAASLSTSAAINAAHSASVSYRDSMPASVIEDALLTGQIERAFLAQLTHLVDEVPTPMLLRAVRETADSSGLPAKRLWRNLLTVASVLRSPNPRWRSHA